MNTEIHPQDLVEFKTLHDAATNVLNGLEDLVTNWEELYDILGLSWDSIRKYANTQNVEEMDNITYGKVLTGVTMMSAYLSFRQKQPTMNDFELAWVHIMQEARNITDMGFEDAVTASKEASQAS